LRRVRGLLGALVFLCAATAGFTRPARAAQILWNGKVLQFDVTEVASVSYNADSGNIAPPTDPINYDPTGSKWYDFLNRLDMRLTYDKWHGELRLDSAIFWSYPTLPPGALDPTNPNVQQNRSYARALANRYVNNLQIEKINIGYQSENLDATLGDFYISYGRGLILSILKIDALGVDTTVRGGNVTARLGGFSLNVAGGITNVVNTDPATGYVTVDPNDVILASRAEYRLPSVFVVGAQAVRMLPSVDTANLNRYTPGAPSYTHTPLSYLGIGSISTDPPFDCTGPSRPLGCQSVRDTTMYGATFELPKISDIARFYFEWDHQHSAYLSQRLDGDGIYSAVDLYLGSFTVLAQVKDYKNFFFPIQSSLPNGLATPASAAFWQQNVYTLPPNLEPILQEEQPTSDIVGPRLRVDWHANNNLTPYISGAYFVDGSNKYDIYDGYLGTDAYWQNHASHATISVGRRQEVYNNGYSVDFQGHLHAMEYWVQYDVVQSLGPVYSLELDGLERYHKDDQLSRYFVWNWGYSYLSLKRREWSASFGFEYNTETPLVNRPYNYNVSGLWNITDLYSLRAFIGELQSGLRCVNGVCRNFPGFTGISVEFTGRY